MQCLNANSKFQERFDKYENLCAPKLKLQQIKKVQPQNKPNLIYTPSYVKCLGWVSG